MTRAPFRVILDLDETVIHCYPDAPVGELISRGINVITLGDGTPILVRPYFYQFLAYLSNHFDEIYVYTAATATYAKEVVEVIFRGLPPVKIWTRNSCHYVEDRVYKTLHGKISSTGLPMDTQRTIMIDDRAEVTDYNLYTKGTSHIVIPRFEGAADDTALLETMTKLTNWKRTLVMQGG